MTAAGVDQNHLANADDGTQGRRRRRSGTARSIRCPRGGSFGQLHAPSSAAELPFRTSSTRLGEREPRWPSPRRGADDAKLATATVLARVRDRRMKRQHTGAQIPHRRATARTEHTAALGQARSGIGRMVHRQGADDHVERRVGETPAPPRRRPRTSAGAHRHRLRGERRRWLGRVRPSLDRVEPGRVQDCDGAPARAIGCRVRTRSRAHGRRSERPPPRRRRRA